MLRGYLQDKVNARLMGVAPTGNGRRESFAHMTLPRMTNTYMLPGKHDPQEILGSVKKGLYCQELRRRPGRHHVGQVRVLGQRGLPDRERQAHRAGAGATLIGNGPDVLGASPWSATI